MKSMIIGIVAGIFLAIAIFAVLVPNGPDMIRVYNLERFTSRNKSMDTTKSVSNPYMMAKITSEKQFLQEMKLHHESAITMAQQLLKLNPRPELKDLANDIITAQTSEIKMMKDWLSLWK